VSPTSKSTRVNPDSSAVQAQPATAPDGVTAGPAPAGSRPPFQIAVKSRQELDSVTIGGGEVLAPAHAELQKQVIVATLKSEIFGLWFHRLENKYWIGKKLWQLQKCHAKPGSGTFLEDLTELDIPRPTGYRYITFFQRIRAGFDPTPIRLSRNEKDKLFATTEGPKEDDSTLELTADQERAKVAEAISAAKEHVEKAKARSKNMAGGYNVKCKFTEMERTKFKAKYKALGEKKASKIMYQAVMNAK
jgi:hypothetical protein